MHIHNKKLFQKFSQRLFSSRLKNEFLNTRVTDGWHLIQAEALRGAKAAEHRHDGLAGAPVRRQVLARHQQQLRAPLPRLPDSRLRLDSCFFLILPNADQHVELLPDSLERRFYRLSDNSFFQNPELATS